MDCISVEFAQNCGLHVNVPDPENQILQKPVRWLYPKYACIHILLIARGSMGRPYRSHDLLALWLNLVGLIDVSALHKSIYIASYFHVDSSDKMAVVRPARARRQKSSMPLNFVRWVWISVWWIRWWACKWVCTPCIPSIPYIGLTFHHRLSLILLQQRISIQLLHQRWHLHCSLNTFALFRPPLTPSRTTSGDLRLAPLPDHPSRLLHQSFSPIAA